MGIIIRTVAINVIVSAMGAEYRTPVTPRNFGRVITNGTFIKNSPIRDKIISFASACENLVNNVIQ